MTDQDLKECRIIMNRIGENMGIIADHLRDDAGVKIKRLSRALQLYRQHTELDKCREEIGGFMYQGFSRN